MMVIPRNLKQFTRSTSAPVMSTQVCVFASFFLKSTISSLVLLTLSSRLFSVHHSATLLISIVDKSRVCSWLGYQNSIPVSISTFFRHCTRLCSNKCVISVFSYHGNHGKMLDETHLETMYHEPSSSKFSSIVAILHIK